MTEREREGDKWHVIWLLPAYGERRVMKRLIERIRHDKMASAVYGEYMYE
jgi:hypothetical protein